MLRAHLIDEPTRARAAAQPIVLARARAATAPVVPWYTEQVRKLVKGAMPDELARGGLVVETAALPALGTELARDASLTRRNGPARIRAASDRPRMGALLWDHTTGYIEALVGGTLWGPGKATSST